MLGEVLIQTFQNLHKGSMFKLAKNIKKANKEFKIFKEIFNNFAKLSVGGKIKCNHRKIK